MVSKPGRGGAFQVKVRVKLRAGPQPRTDIQINRNSLLGFAHVVQAVWARIFREKRERRLIDVGVLSVPVPVLQVAIVGCVDGGFVLGGCAPVCRRWAVVAWLIGTASVTDAADCARAGVPSAAAKPTARPGRRASLIRRDRDFSRSSSVAICAWVGSRNAAISRARSTVSPHAFDVSILSSSFTIRDIAILFAFQVLVFLG